MQEGKAKGLSLHIQSGQFLFSFLQYSPEWPLTPGVGWLVGVSGDATYKSDTRMNGPE